jgi:hypothetical protein
MRETGINGVKPFYIKKLIAPSGLVKRQFECPCHF